MTNSGALVLANSGTLTLTLANVGSSGFGLAAPTQPPATSLSSGESDSANGSHPQEFTLPFTHATAGNGADADSSGAVTADLGGDHLDGWYLA